MVNRLSEYSGVCANLAKLNIFLSAQPNSARYFSAIFSWAVFNMPFVMDIVNGLHMCRPDCVNWYYTGLLSAISSSLAQVQTIREYIRRAVCWYYKECVCEMKVVLTWTVLLHYSCSKSVQTHTILNLQYLWHQP